MNQGKNFDQLMKFHALMRGGKQAALDLTADGRLLCVATVSRDGQRIGNGTPSIPAPSSVRIMSCIDTTVLVGA